MMFFIMLSLPGALGLYYVTSNIFAAVQQHFLLQRDAEEMDKMAIQQAKKKAGGKKATAKAREKVAREAEIVDSKDDGVKITRIRAKESPRRKEDV